MKVFALASTLAIAALACAPCSAEETVQPGESKARAICGKVTALPKSVAGVICGVTVGVPVKIARSVAHETLRMRTQLTDDLGGDQPDMGAKVIGSYLAMPYGVAAGFIKGAVQGTERGIECGHRKPFSKESMSLSDPN
ncbi:MAG TPA: hypothetical protein V6D17_07990 [Candidatus Obscuribacterales bacterium]